MTDAHFLPERSPVPRERDLVVLTGADLSVADVEAVARHGARAALDVHARDRMQEARDVIERLVARGEVVYGVTTGFGDLATTSIPPDDAARLQENLLASHAAGVGRPFPREVVRAMLLLRANTLALGHSGCRPLLVDRICEFLALGIHPVVPEQGSVGASGDLAPLAHLALPLIGRGQVELNGQVLPALIALRETGLEPLTLGPKEGLALLNGTQLMSALGALLLADADRLIRTASVAAAMSLEALLGTEVAYAAPYQLARPHPGQVAVAGQLRHLLRGSGLQTRAPRVRTQGPGPVLAALRATGPRRGARLAGPPPARAGRGAQLRDGQPARVPRGRRGPGRRARDGRRPGHLRRQLPR